MKRPILAAILAALALTAPALDSPPYENIVHPKLSWSLTSGAKINGDLLTVTTPSNGTAWATATVDLTPYDDIPFVMEIEIAGTNIAHNETSYYGLKFMLSYTNGVTGYWPQATRREGTFEKQKFTYREYLTEGRRSKTGTLSLGIQNCAGTAVFDLSTLQFATAAKIWPQCPWAPRTNEDYVVTYPAAITNAAQLRGVMLPSGDCKEDDFATLATWGATLGRYQMTSAPTYNTNLTAEANLAAYNTWMAHKLDHLDKDVLPWAVKYGLKLVIDIHDPPGGRYGTVNGTKDYTFRVMDEDLFKDRFIEIWREIATRFKGRAGVYGYDIYNEPYQTRQTKWDYWTLQRIAAEAIRKIDPDTPIIVESSGMDAAEAFSYLSPLAMDNVIYQVHCYSPGEFTHQGVNGSTVTNHYPDAEKGWDRDYLVNVLAPVRKFEAKHHAKIYMGEFSAINWGEGADQYIAHMISIVNEYGWDWTYHAFREWAGWSVEHDWPRDGSPVASADNPRKRALLAGMRAHDGRGQSTEIVADDSFENDDLGLTPIQLHRGWSGDGKIVAETYAAPTPPGAPLPAATHTRVLAVDDDAAEKDISTTNAANRVIDLMARVKVTPRLETPEADVLCALTVGGDGRFRLWCAAGWVVLSPDVYADGDWVRVEIESIASSVDGGLYHRVRLNGSLCPTEAGVRAPDNPLAYGPWYRSAVQDAAAPTVLGVSATHVDDLRVTSVAVAPAHSGPTATNGIAFAWFDAWGLPRRPDDRARSIPGYTLADVYASGVNPYGDEPLTLKSFTVGDTVEMTFNGFREAGAALDYEVFGASSLESLLAGGTPLTGAFTGDAASWTTTWRGAPAADMKFFRVRSKSAP